MIAIIFIVLASFSMLFLIARLSKSRMMVEEWAEHEGYHLLNAERRWLLRGPFFFLSDKEQDVYYVTVADAAGQIRHAYIRCGGWFLGMLSDQISVRWAE